MIKKIAESDEAQDNGDQQRGAGGNTKGVKENLTGAFIQAADGTKIWEASGLLEKIFHDLGEDADLQDISMDSTFVKAHKASAGVKRGGE